MLCTRVGVCLVQANVLEAEKVLPRGRGGRNGKVPAVVRVTVWVSGPLNLIVGSRSAGTNFTELPDLLQLRKVWCVTARSAYLEPLGILLVPRRYIYR
jgi:hypothetical protein